MFYKDKYFKYIIGLALSFTVVGGILIFQDIINRKDVPEKPFVINQFTYKEGDSVYIKPDSSLVKIVWRGKLASNGDTSIIYGVSKAWNDVLVITNDQIYER